MNPFLGIVDLKNGEFTYSQVGETAACIKHTGMEAGVLECMQGFSLGELKNVNYPQETCHLKQGEAVLLYTEGIAIQKDEKGYDYTDVSVLSSWNYYMKQEYSLNSIVDSMFGALKEHANEAEIQQDQTILCFRYNGN